ncbi:MAG: hypothetical protein ACJ0RN_01970 [Candidatus Neomarinimicrobiota bacterium]|tara:strand:- start:4938 stop:5519 length:582 start_codon:yes stop_codon:yes gene_type:complete
MIKKLNIVVLLITVFLFGDLYGQSDRILLKGECNSENIALFTSFLNDRSNIKISIQTSKDDDVKFNNHAIVILCSDGYLKLSELEIISLRKNLLNGSLLIIDNFTSDYTFSIFLKKILPEYSHSQHSLSVVAKDNPYKVNFENIDINTRQIFIGEKLRILAIQDKSLLDEINNENLEYTKLLATLVFNYLIGY